MPDLRAVAPPEPSAPADARPGPDPLLALAREAAAGDLTATARVLEAVAPRVASTVGAVMGRGHPDLDDVIQLSLIALLQALPSFRGECQPASYASRIAVRTAVRARQKVRRQQAWQEPTADLERASDEGRSPGDELRARQRQAIVRGLLEELPEEQAESLALRVVLGWSLDDVASATGAPLNTVRSRIRLAKEALRRKIEGVPGLAEELEGSP